MLSISKKSLKINYLPSKMDDIQFSQADITLAKKEIDFNPKSQLEDLRKMMK